MVLWVKTVLNLETLVFRPPQVAKTRSALFISSRSPLRFRYSPSYPLFLVSFFPSASQVINLLLLSPRAFLFFRLPQQSPF